ncbi:MAG: GGDEF domain-containing protein [Anaeroplasmataceae bacterium]
MIKEIIKNYDDSYCYDSLTKLYNRQIIEEYASMLIEKNISFSLVIIDIDNFKYVNDSYGHIQGDKVLVSVADSILNTIGDHGIVGRYGGDEFIAVIDAVEYEDLWNLLHDLAFGVNYIKNEELPSLMLSITIGTSRFPLNSNKYEDLFEFADKALYRGKMKGRNCFIIYLPEKHANIDLKTQKDKSFSSMYLHAKVFNFLTVDDLNSGISNLFKYLVDYLMLDHICINTSKLEYSFNHKLCNQEFEIINTDLIKSISDNSGLVYNNFVDAQMTNKELKETLLKQNIHACCFIKIEAYGKYYGYLRADSLSGNGRIWQTSELDLLVTAAKTIAIIKALTEK